MLWQLPEQERRNMGANSYPPPQKKAVHSLTPGHKLKELAQNNKCTACILGVIGFPKSKSFDLGFHLRLKISIEETAEGKTRAKIGVLKITRIFRKKVEPFLQYSYNRQRGREQHSEVKRTERDQWRGPHR